MKYRVKKQGWIWVLPLVVFLASCHDFLHKFPENTVEAADVDYTQTADMYMPVSGVYGTAQLKLSAWAAYGLITVRGDDVEKGSAPNDQVLFNAAKQFQYEEIKSFFALNATWEGYYNLITIANAALESLDKYAEYITTDADRQRYREYTAEVRFIRAYTYFQLVTLWGEIPLLVSNQQLNVTKAPIADVYKYIFTELEYCINNLPALRPNEMTEHKGAVTRYSALALYAKANLYRENWDVVLQATNEIIESRKFSLYGDFYQLFKIPGKLSDESLYELQYTDFDTPSGQVVQPDQWFVFQGPRGNDSPIQGWGFIVPTEIVRNYFHSRGETIRDTTTFLLTGHTTPSGDYIKPSLEGDPSVYNGKAYTPSNQMTPGRLDYGTNNNIRILRYADVLLMNAEVKIRLGQNGDGPLNLVRQRAHMPAISNATLDDVLNERRAEFAVEWGQRYFDLVRTGRAAGTLPGFVAGKSEYYPIPQNQVDLNENLAEDVDPVPVDWDAIYGKNQ